MRVRDVAFLALLALSGVLFGCQAPKSAIQLSAFNYKTVTVLEDAVLVKNAACLTIKSKERCDAISLGELEETGALLEAANEYDDLRKGGFLLDASLTLDGIRTNVGSLVLLLDVYLSDADRKELEWFDE